MPTPIQHVPGTGQMVLWFHPNISAFLVLGCGSPPIFGWFMAGIPAPWPLAPSGLECSPKSINLRRRSQNPKLVLVDPLKLMEMFTASLLQMSKCVCNMCVYKYVSIYIYVYYCLGFLKMWKSHKFHWFQYQDGHFHDLLDPGAPMPTSLFTRFSRPAARNSV